MAPSLRGVFSLSLLWFIGAGTASAQPSLLFYQNSQDQARSFDVDSLVAGSSVTGFLGAIAGNARNIAASERSSSPLPKTLRAPRVSMGLP